MTSKREQGWRLLLGLCLFCWLCWTPQASASLPGDYEPENNEWNGLSGLVEAARAEGIELIPKKVLDYRKITSSRPLMVVFPERLSVDSFKNFLAEGGRVLLADDYGAGRHLLSTFGMTFSERLSPDQPQRYLLGNPNLPILETNGTHPLFEEEVKVLVGNHAVLYRANPDTLPAVVYYDDHESGFAYDLTVGMGKLVVVADASLYINLMLGQGDNRAFAMNTLRYLCADLPDCQVELYVGGFESRGAFAGKGEEEAAPTLQEKVLEKLDSFNDILSSLDEMVPERRVLRAIAMVLAVGLALFCLTVFPMRRPRFLGIRFRPEQRSLPRSVFERNIAAFRKGGALNYALPVALLRDEFEYRFIRALHPDGAGPRGVACYLPGTIRDLAKRFEQKVSQRHPERSGGWEQRIISLMRQFARAPMKSQVFVDTEVMWSDKALLELYHESIVILGMLGVRDLKLPEGSGDDD